MTLQSLIDTHGYWLLALGCLLEGETILLLAGFAAHRGYLDPWAVFGIASLAGFAGDQFYFWLGRRHGAAVLARWPRLAERTGRSELCGLLVSPDRLEGMGVSAAKLAIVLRDLAWWNGKTSPFPQAVYQDCFLPEAGVVKYPGMTPDARRVILAAKAGHNDGHHSHANVGTFILHVDGENLLTDPGRGLYSRQYFADIGRFHQHHSIHRRDCHRVGELCIDEGEIGLCPRDFRSSKNKFLFAALDLERVGFGHFDGSAGALDLCGSGLDLLDAGTSENEGLPLFHLFQRCFGAFPPASVLVILGGGNVVVFVKCLCPLPVALCAIQLCLCGLHRRFGLLNFLRPRPGFQFLQACLVSPQIRLPLFQVRGQVFLLPGQGCFGLGKLGCG